MGEANRLVGLSPSDDYYEFYGRLEQRLRDPEPGSLIARFADAPHTDTHARRPPDPALDVRDARHARAPTSSGRWR